MAKAILLYIQDDKYFRLVQAEVKKLWYMNHGESLTNSAMVIKALINLRDNLSGKIDDNKGQDIHKYSRTRLQGNKSL